MGEKVIKKKKKKLSKENKVIVCWRDIRKKKKIT